jgi:hypothetical protein
VGQQVMCVCVGATYRRCCCELLVGRPGKQHAQLRPRERSRLCSLRRTDSFDAMAFICVCAGLALRCIVAAPSVYTYSICIQHGCRWRTLWG